MRNRLIVLCKNSIRSSLVAIAFNGHKVGKKQNYYHRWLIEVVKAYNYSIYMNNISTDFISEENTTVADETQIGSRSPLLPRSAWNSQLVYFKVVFRAKKALDRIEKEADVSKTLN